MEIIITVFSFIALFKVHILLCCHLDLKKDEVS